MKKKLNSFLHFVINRKICSVFGHKWDESDKLRQKCKRCNIERVRCFLRHKHMIGEKAYSWMIIDFDL